jgi:hypothetical protein
LLPWYQHLFSEDELERARFRLTEHRFDVNALLADARQRVPKWAQAEDPA